jgi:Eco57I restriction-modification methylase
MNLELDDCVFAGSALPEPFVRFELTAQLVRLRLLVNDHASEFDRGWTALRRQLRATSGPQSICNHVLAPLAERLGFERPARQNEVATREGIEDGGWLLQSPGGTWLRAWSFANDTDVDAPHRTGRAYRFSPMRSAQRVLLAKGECLGLLTNGEELRLLLSDPARLDSHVVIPLAGNGGWRARSLAPDSYRLLLASATPRGIVALPELLDAARLNQSRVTKDLRLQARSAIEGFLQAVLDHPANRVERNLHLQAKTLWEEGLILVYRLLFIMKLESAADPARAFSFASTGLWRDALSPNRALGPLARRLLDHGHDTGRMLEDGLRLVFRAFREGLSCSELLVTPLGGGLFDPRAMPLLDRLAWGERAVALLLDQLLWVTPRGNARQRVHYGALDVEDLGRIYEALLELEPGIATEAMSRLRHARMDAVVPVQHAARYRGAGGDGKAAGITCVEDIPAGRFFVRAGTGRKATGSYYTPHAFVRFLVRETLAPQIAARSPDADPNPRAILAIKVVDPATGSGHFLVEVCRFLGEALYAACRMCDELAAAAEDAAREASPNDCARLQARAAALRKRIADLPDPDGLLRAYLPSRVSEGGASGLSQSRALTICRRMIAMHCLYGVDSNRLAVELAKLSLWLESYAEGLPLTFLDHRLVHGDSIAGAFFSSMATLPVAGSDLDTLLAQDLNARLGTVLDAARHEVHALQATVGADAASLALKEAAKCRLDATLQPLRLLARTWSGAVMLAVSEADEEWLALARTVAATGTWPKLSECQAAMLAAGSQALPWDLTFPEVFGPRDADVDRSGFDAVLSNPPWDVMQPNSAEFLAGFDLSILNTRNGHQAGFIRSRLLAQPAVANAWRGYHESFVRQARVVDRLYLHQRIGAHDAVMGGKLDLYRVFTERMVGLVGSGGAVGMVVPSAFHANEGATGVRKLYLQETRIEQCLSFENRRSLFDIHGRYRFALVVARRPGPTRALRCGFYLKDFADLEAQDRRLEYDQDFMAASGGPHATLLELRDAADLALARQMFLHARSFRQYLHDVGIALSREIHMSGDAHRFTPLTELPGLDRHPTDGCAVNELCDHDYLLLHEGKTIHQFTDRWHTEPRYAINARALTDKPMSLAATQYYRAACREIARSTDERTAIAAILPPGVLCGHTINVERRPALRPNAAALALVGLMNSFPFDWALRQKASIHASLYILSSLPVPAVAAEAQHFLAHASLRLCCNHAGFAPLWHEQLGDAWLEVSAQGLWPVTPAENARWGLRGAIDAVVAHAYGLSRKQYQHMLASFSHKSFPAAPIVCLAAFDELAEKGLGAFCRDHDPYWNIPRVSATAAPVVRLSDRSVAATAHSHPSARRHRRGASTGSTPGLHGSRVDYWPR